MKKEDFAQRITGMQQKMYRITCAYLASEHDRLDAISEAVLKAWQKHTGLREEKYFDSWLIRILIRECINVQRRQKRILPVEQIPEIADEKADDVSCMLRSALENVPEKLRIVLVLHYMEGYGVDDIGRMLHVTRGSVCSMLSRGRQKLQVLLGEEIE